MLRVIPNKLREDPTLRKILLGIVLWQGLVWLWIPFTDTAALSGSTAIGIALSLLVYILFVLIGSAVFVAASTYFLNKHRELAGPSRWFIVQLFFGWALVEAFAAWAVMIVWFGSGGSIDSTVPFGSLTPLLMYTPLKYAARLLGFYGLSAAVVVVTVVLISKKLQSFRIGALSVLVGLSLLGWLLYRVPNGEAITAVITAEQLNEQQQIVSDADLVVLPEYGLDGVSETAVQSRVAEASDKEVYVVGSQQAGTGVVKNTLLLGSTRQGFINEQAKTRLIPGSEHLPYTLEFLLRAVGAQETLLHFNITRAVTKGEAPIQVLSTPRFILGSAVCSSIIAPEDYRRLVQQGATLLTNSASLEVFRNSRLYLWHHEGMARFMAVAHARPFLQSANGASAFALDHQGNLIGTAPPISNKEVRVTTNQRTTIYTYIGEWPVTISVISIVLSLLRYLHRRLSTRIKQ